MSQRFVDPLHLNGENVTIGDCAERFLLVHLSCRKWSLIRGFNPNCIKGPARTVPIVDLFVSRKLVCGTCRTPSDGLKVMFQGNSIVPSRTLLDIVEN